MEIAVLGLKQSGKSTLFQIMTGINSAEVYGESTVPGVAKVPDGRFDRLVEIFKPAKVTPASIPFTDVNVQGEKGWDDIRGAISGCDSIIHVVDCFTTNDVPEMMKRYRTLESELIFSDLMIVERGDIKLVSAALNGQETMLEVLSAGEVLGELSAIDGASRSVPDARRPFWANSIASSRLTTIFSKVWFSFTIFFISASICGKSSVEIR